MNTVLVAGIGRSGTTWLGDVINYDNRYRTLFEPLHPEHGIPLRKQLINGLYMPPDVADAQLRVAADAMLRGQFQNEWAQQYDTNPTSDHILLKAIRLNLMLPWLHAQFPDMPIVYIVRHPGAVVSSQMRMKWGDGSLLLNRLRAQPALMDATLKPFERVMARARDEFERRLMIWCAINYTLHYLLPERVHVVLYERLTTHPESEIPRLFNYLGQSHDSDAVMSLMGKPSATTWSDGQSAEDSVRALNKWQVQLSPGQRAIMAEVLALFGLHQLYGADSIPLVDWHAIHLQPDIQAIRRWRRVWWSFGQ